MFSRTAWLARLAALSPVAHQVVQGTSFPDVDYRGTMNNNIVHVDAFNFCADNDHNIALARCLDNLAAIGANTAAIKKYLIDLTSGNLTYGTVCELLTYDWLNQNGIPFEAQVAVTGAEILNPSGSDLDGKLTASSDVYFDIKAFGFQEITVERLKRRLESDLPGWWIAVEGSWDVSAEILQTLLEPIEYNKLRADLAAAITVERGVLQFVRREARPVRVSSRRSDPYAMAEEHGSYTFRFAKQFARHKPFVLFLAFHPWLGGLSLNTDFASCTSTYMRALARRTFIQFLEDKSLLFGETKGHASRLISGIGFLNVSHIPPQQGEASCPAQPRLRLFINPNAINPMPDLTVDAVRWEQPGSVMVDDFRHDNY